MAKRTLYEAPAWTLGSLGERWTYGAHELNWDAKNNPRNARIELFISQPARYFVEVRREVCSIRGGLLDAIALADVMLDEAGF